MIYEASFYASGRKRHPDSKCTFPSERYKEIIQGRNERSDLRRMVFYVWVSTVQVAALVAPYNCYVLPVDV